MTLGDTIKKLRQRRGITQTDLANDLVVSHSSVAMWETDKRDPDTKMIVLLAEYFKVSCDYLLKNDEVPIVETFGSRLKELRGGIKQQKIADSIGVARASYSHYENDIADPSLVTLCNIAKYFNVTSDYLLGMDLLEVKGDNQNEHVRREQG